MQKSVFVKSVKYGEKSTTPTQMVLGSMCYCRSTNECVMGGGLSDTTTVSGSLVDMKPQSFLWVYKLDTGNWSKDESFSLPKDLMGCSLISGNIIGKGQKLYVFGGIGESKIPQNELYVYDYNTKEWKMRKVEFGLEPNRHYIRALMFFTDKDYRVVKVEDSPAVRYLGIFGMGVAFRYLFFFDIIEEEFVKKDLMVEEVNLPQHKVSVFGGLEVAIAGQYIYAIQYSLSIAEKDFLCNRVFGESNLYLSLIRLNLKTVKWEKVSGNKNSPPPKEMTDYKYIELHSYREKYLIGWGYAGVDRYPTAEVEEKKLGDRKSNHLFVYDIGKGLWSTCKVLCHPEEEGLVVRRYLCSTMIINDQFYVYGGSYCGKFSSEKDQLEFRDLFYFDLRYVLLEDNVAIEDEKERKEYLMTEYLKIIMEEEEELNLVKMIKFIPTGEIINILKIFLTLTEINI